MKSSAPSPDLSSEIIRAETSLLSASERATPSESREHSADFGSRRRSDFGSQRRSLAGLLLSPRPSITSPESNIASRPSLGGDEIEIASEDEIELAVSRPPEATRKIGEDSAGPLSLPSGRAGDLRTDASISNWLKKWKLWGDTPPSVDEIIEKYKSDLVGVDPEADCDVDERAAALRDALTNYPGPDLRAFLKPEDWTFQGRVTELFELLEDLHVDFQDKQKVQEFTKAVGQLVGSVILNGPLLVEKLTSNMPPSVPVNVRYNPKQFEEVKKYILDALTVKETKIDDPQNPGEEKTVEVGQICLWPFLRAVITQGEEGMGEKGQALYQKLIEGGLYRFESEDPDLANTLKERFNGPEMQQLKASLTVLQIARFHYGEDFKTKEHAWTLGKGMGIGLAIEFFMEYAVGLSLEKKLKTGEKRKELIQTAIRTLSTFCTATYGNLIGLTVPMAERLQHLGLKASKETVFGTDHLPKGKLDEIRRRIFMLVGGGDANGPAADAVRQRDRFAVIAGVFAAAIGVPLNRLLSNPDAARWQLLLMNSGYAYGSSTANLFNFAAIQDRMTLAAKHYLREDFIRLPDAIKDDPTAVEKYLVDVASQEEKAIISIDSATKAFICAGLPTAVVWLAGLGWQTSISRAVLQPLGVIAGVMGEDSLATIFLALKAKWYAPKVMEGVEQIILQKSKDGKKIVAHELSQPFNGFLSNLANDTMYVATQVPLAGWKFLMKLPQGCVQWRMAQRGDAGVPQLRHTAR